MKTRSLLRAALAACTCLGMGSGVQAQCVGYSVASGPGVFVAGDTDSGSACDDCVTQINFPFNVNFYGSSYGSAGASSNGNLQFTTASIAYANDCIPSPTITGPTIFPFWDDQYTLGTAAGQGIFTGLSGSPGSQVFVIEYRTNFCCTTAAPINDYEIVFYEGQDFFDVIYQTMADRASATVGVQDGNGAGGASTQYVCNAAGPTSGLSLRYSCIAANTVGACCAASGSCAPGSSATCAGSGGTFFGLGSSCSPTPCPTGACCSPAGCSLVIHQACTGTFHAGGTCTATYPPPTQTADVLEDISINGPNPGTAFVPGGNGGINSLDDGNDLNIPIGFTFNFYGQPQTTMSICTNGVAYFGAGDFSGYPAPATIPAAGNPPTNCVAPYWQDLDFPAGGASQITYATNGTAPYRRFIVEWSNAPRYNNTGQGFVTFELILYETADALAFRYGNIDAGVPTTGPNNIVGVEAAGATDATSVDPSTLGSGNTALVWQVGVNPCSGSVATGACCAGGTCMAVPYGSCLATSGAFQGNATTCTSAPCLSGACCAITGGCTLAVQSICTSANGVFQGVGHACGAAPCPPGGSCCNGTSCAAAFQANCSGQFTASGSCSPNLCGGACCDPSGTCSFATQNNCAGTFSGAGSTCAAGMCTGACCDPTTGLCTITGSGTCASSSQFQGLTTTCTPNPCPQPPTGACCIASTQTCTDVFASTCAASGGSYQGDNTSCASAACPFGACCLPCIGCFVATSSDCAGQSGTYNGDGSTCEAAGCSIINGGFESAAIAPGWTQFGDTSDSGVFGPAPFASPGTGLVAHGGSYGMDFGPVTGAGGIQQTIPAHAGDMVTIGFWYAAAGATNSFDCTFDGSSLVSFTNDTTNTTWTQFTFPGIVVSADNPVLMFTITNPPSWDDLDDITVCIASSTGSGVCCRGSTCNTSVTQAGCVPSGGTAGAHFVSSVSACNSAALSNSPCCYADYNKANGVTVQDIFDFLTDWFAGSHFAKVGGDGASGGLSVQNIFDFLNNWFAGGCS